MKLFSTLFLCILNELDRFTQLTRLFSPPTGNHWFQMLSPSVVRKDKQ